MLANKVSEDDLKDILSAGIRVPDHGALNPWKIVVIKDERLEKFDKEVILPEFLRENPDASEKEIEIESSRLQEEGLCLRYYRLLLSIQKFLDGKCIYHLQLYV